MKKRLLILVYLIGAFSILTAQQTYRYTAPELDFSDYVKTTSEKALGVNLPSMEDKLVNYVDPFIGTGGHGHTFPGATVPFGMVQISPDNEYYGWDWCSGYNWFGKKIIAFSHKHLSGTGARDLGDIAFLPSKTGKDKGITFSHENEYAQAGYYGVKLDNGILAEFTAGQRSAYHRYTFDREKNNFIQIDLTHDISGKGGIKTAWANFKKISDTELGGVRISTGWAPIHRVYFFAEFSSPYKMRRKGRKAVLNFDSEKVLVKVGISSVSIDGAKANLKEIDGKSFEQVLVEASEAWEKELQKITVEGQNEADKTAFYTAAYHAYIAPVMYSDADGRFKDPKGKIVQAEGYDRYSTFSLWDTFRAAHPLYTFTQEERVNDFVNSMLAHYDQRGYLPIWELESAENYCMIGNHSVPVIVEAYLKGIRDYDVEKAYEACYKTVMQNRKGLKAYKKYGYVPADKHGESVSITLEYAYDDWAVYKFAQALGKKEDAEFFLERSKNYKNLFDPEYGLMRAKDSKGNWVEPFDPFVHRSGGVRHYTEGNAWQYTWFVPHDVEGLISLFESREEFTEQLKKLFVVSKELKASETLVDVTGLIGEYAHGNEPSHHTAYLFNWSSDKSETARLVNQICKEMYTDKADGLCGNEDCGQMSAWYVFSAMGFYPVDPVALEYQLGTPLFDKAEMKLANGKTFTVIAERETEDAIYPSKITLNGKELDRTFITYEEIMEGGELVFVLE